MIRNVLWRDRRGVSALEFALTVPVLIALTGFLADVGLLEQTRDSLTAAVNAGAQYAALAGTSVTAAAIQTAGQAATTLSPVTISVTGPAYYCTGTGAGGAVTLSTSASGATCGSGATAGMYVEITANYSYRPLMPVGGLLGNTVLDERAVVRLQ